MRVAMLGQYPLNESRIVGGIEAVMVPLVESLRSFPDLQLHVITCQPRVRDELRHTVSGLPLHLRQRRRLGRLTFHARDVAGLRRTLADVAPDIVHTHGTGIYTLAAIGAPYPHITTMHGIVFREVGLANHPAGAGFTTMLAGHLRGALDSYYERYALARVRNLISISPYVEQELKTISGFRGRLFRIENPVEERFFAIGDSPDEATIVYVGRVIPRKGLLDLLQAFLLVRQTVPHATLRVAGETDAAPDYYCACRQFISRHNLDSAVAFLGSLATDGVVQEYARCALLALPSRQETSPVAIAEAMAAGRPVLTTRACGMPYLVEHGQSGLLVDYGDTDGWREAITTLLTDPQLRGRMGRRGREMAEQRFHPLAVARATRAAYYEVAGGVV